MQGKIINTRKARIAAGNIRIDGGGRGRPGDRKKADILADAYNTKTEEELPNFRVNRRGGSN